MNNKLKSKQDKLGNEIKLNSVQSDEGRGDSRPRIRTDQSSLVCEFAIE